MPKYLFDAVYTNRPSVCSTSYLVWDLIEYLSKVQPDAFFYVLYPPHKMEEADWKFMDRFKDRVTLLPLKQTTSDRLSEMYMLRNSLRFYLNPWNSLCWDVDVVVSSRIPVLKHMRVHSSRQLAKAMPSHRMYIGLEEMPILPFRDTVAWSDLLYPDTLTTYGLVDAVMMNNQWTKDLLRPYLREVFSPAWAMRIASNLHEVVPVKLKRLNLVRVYDGGDFNVTFVGRITGTRNFQGVADLFRKAFSFPIGKNKANMKFLVSTNTEASNSDYGEVDFVDMQMNDRSKFYEFLTKAHVAINLSTVEDFSLSTYETLLAGVPTIVADEPWTKFLGPDYPFRVKNNTEAYALLNKFAADYSGMYQLFADWEASWWMKYVENPITNITTGEKMHELVSKFVEKRAKIIKDSGTGGSFIEALAHVPMAEDGTIDLGADLKKNGRMFAEVAEHFSLTLGKVPTTLMYKLIAQQEGWKDTNTVGVMKK